MDINIQDKRISYTDNIGNLDINRLNLNFLDVLYFPIHEKEYQTLYTIYIIYKVHYDKIFFRPIQGFTFLCKESLSNFGDCIANLYLQEGSMQLCTCHSNQYTFIRILISVMYLQKDKEKNTNVKIAANILANTCSWCCAPLGNQKGNEENKWKIDNNVTYFPMFNIFITWGEGVII